MRWILEKLHSSLLKYVIFTDIDAKAAIYLPLTVLLSVATQLYPLPDTYFDYKDNVFNRGFMKLSYQWNTIVLIPFAVIIAYAYSKGNLVDVFYNVVRTLIAIFACQAVRRLLFDVETYYDHCSRNASILRSEQECTSHGYEWITFSLSGHTYYLFYYSLISMEEMKLYTIWQSYAKAISEVESSEASFENISVFRSYTIEDFLWTKKFITSFSGFMKSWVVFIGIYIVTLHFCTLTTLIYFHEIDEKLCGSILAIVTWYVVYKCFFSRLIQEIVKFYCYSEEQSIDKKLNEDWYSYEVRKMYYFKKIQCFAPFFQPNFDI